MNPQIKFSGGINPALLFITCALINIPPFSHWCHQHTFVPMKKLFCPDIQKSSQYSLIGSRRSRKVVDRHLSPDLAFHTWFSNRIESRATSNIIYTICSPTLLCVYLCFAVGYQSSWAENMAPLTRAWLAKLFTPSPSPQRQLLLNLSLSSVFLQIRMEERVQ